MQHSAEIFPAIDRLLKNHGRTPDQIDQVYLAVGPGSFTGLRIAVALAKTMHLATGVKIVTVGSLDVVVANLSDLPTGQFDTQEGPTALPERVAALFDAKRGQFYAATYQHLGSESEAPPATDAEDPGYRISASDIGLWRKSSPDRLMTAPEIVGNSPGLGGLGLLGDGLLYQRDKFATDRVVILPERFWGPRAANVHRLGYQKAQAGLFSDPLALIPRYLRGPEVTLRKGS
jgi:tRNA threonylcarbamoyl adenosine modification protein YeaZ